MTLVDAKSCTGCTACFSVCPRHAIEMKADGEGFLQPVISRESCVNCGLCRKVCPVLNLRPKSDTPRCYAFRTGDRDLLMKSTSGGAFSTLAQPVLDGGGCVFGCELGKQSLVAVHVKIEGAASLQALRGSKYVQSDLRNTLGECRKELQSGREVLFSGTPCQIAGLKAFLGRDYANLLCVEVICHGAASPAILQKEIAEVENRQKAKIANIAFRNKNSEKRYSLRFSFENRSEKRLPDVYCKDFFLAYAANLSLRKSCYTCPFKEGRSGADFTIADFWQVEKCGKGLEYGDGMSLIVVHTDRAAKFFDRLMKTLSPKPLLCEVSPEDAFRGNLNYYYPTQAPGGNRRDKFMACFRSQPIGRLALRLTRKPLLLRVASRLKREIKAHLGGKK